MTPKRPRPLTTLLFAAWLGIAGLSAAAAPKPEPARPPAAVQGQAKPAVREAAPINRQQQAGHVSGTPQHLNRIKQGKATSTFFGERSGAALTRKTWETGTPVPGRPQLRERVYPHTTGVGPNGGFQRGVRVSINKKGEIHGNPFGPEVK
jgi:hypothetical protein